MNKNIKIRVKATNHKEGFVKLCKGKSLMDYCFYLGDETKFQEETPLKKINYIDLGVVEYEVVTVKPIMKKVSNECNVVYYIQEKGDFGFKRTDYTFENEQSAFKKALTLSLENGRDYKVEKSYNLNDNICCDLNVTKEIVFEKPNLQLNQKINEIHEYMFYGVAVY